MESNESAVRNDDTPSNDSTSSVETTVTVESLTPIPTATTTSNIDALQHPDNSISMAPSSHSDTTANHPLPEIIGYQRRPRRTEAELRAAAEMVAGGATFQAASEKYNIAISTIRFYMVCKGMLRRQPRPSGGSTYINASINYLRNPPIPQCS